MTASFRSSRVGLRGVGGTLLLLTVVTACSPRMHVRFREEASPIQPGDQISAAFIVDPISIRIAITNFGDEPVQILWHKSSMVGVHGEAMQIIHEGDRDVWAAWRVTGEDFSTIPPGATLRDTIYSRRAVYPEVHSYLPLECDRESCEYGDLASRQIRLSLTLRRGEVEDAYTWTFRIDETYE